MIFLPFYLPNSSLLRNPVLGSTALVLWIVGQVSHPVTFFGSETAVADIEFPPRLYGSMKDINSNFSVDQRSSPASGLQAHSSSSSMRGSSALSSPTCSTLPYQRRCKRKARRANNNIACCRKPSTGTPPKHRSTCLLIFHYDASHLARRENA